MIHVHRDPFTRLGDWGRLLGRGLSSSAHGALIKLPEDLYSMAAMLLTTNVLMRWSWVKTTVTSGAWNCSVPGKSTIFFL